MKQVKLHLEKKFPASVSLTTLKLSKLLHFPAIIIIITLENTYSFIHNLNQMGRLTTQWQHFAIIFTTVKRLVPANPQNMSCQTFPKR